MTLDPRRHAVRDDLADAHLAGRVERPRYAEGVRHAVAAPLAPGHGRPDADAPLVTEFLHGEPVDVFDTADGWAWVQSAVDGYVAFVEARHLGPAAAPTHVVAVPLAPVFRAPSIKGAPLRRVTLGARVVAAPAEPAGTERFHAVADNFVLAQHLQPLGTHAADFVDVAALFVGAPYQWGGRSWLGIDCSGLVQLALAAAGRDAPRDSDMQAAELGTPTDAPPARGDLVFWRGHVGIMLDADRLLHATGHAHVVVVEPLADVVARHEAKGLPVTTRRRLP